MKITTDQIKKLRDETGAPVIKVKKVLEQEKGDEKKALSILKEEGFKKAAKRADKATDSGIVASYVHHNNRVVGVVELLCETDFVARNELFGAAAQDIAMQVASLDPESLEDLLEQDFIKDPKQKIKDVVKAVIAKTGENVKIGRFHRIAIGD